MKHPHTLNLYNEIQMSKQSVLNVTFHTVTSYHEQLTTVVPT